MRVRPTQLSVVGSCPELVHTHNSTELLASKKREAYVKRPNTTFWGTEKSRKSKKVVGGRGAEIFERKEKYAY